MMSDDDDILEFDFEGVDPAVFGDWLALPKGEYNLQCVGAKKFLTGESKGTPDPTKPNLAFKFVVINHPEYSGRELNELNHSLGEKGRPFLLNTLMCLIPEIDWQGGALKQIRLSELIAKVNGRPVNGTISWSINNGTGDNAGKKYVNNDIQGLKMYDASIPQPVATEGNPPVIDNRNSSVSPTAQQAAAGVPASEVQSFLDNAWPGATAPATSGSTDFGMEPF
jgi:hypothetical protein